MRKKAILHIIMMLVVCVSCDDYDFDEENYVPLHLETTLMDRWHTTIGYAYAEGYVKNDIYDRVGTINPDGKVFDKHYDRVGTIIKQSETRYKVRDEHYDIVGYVNISNGTVINHLYDVVGYGRGENVWKAGVILLLFNE